MQPQSGFCPVRLLDYHSGFPLIHGAQTAMASRSEMLFERACKVIPGGVNSPVRAFGSVGGVPRFIARAKGARVWDADGREYIDYVGSWGPAIAGHAHPKIVEAVREAALDGLSFGAPTEREVRMAEMLYARLPAMEMVRLVSSGTEATMSAIRLARGATGRDAIVKFEGCYHGHGDSLLVKAGSGLLTFGNPSSAGVPADFARHTLVATYNDLASVEALFAEHGARIAAVIVEPVAGNMNLVRPVPGFLEGLRRLCTEHGSVLIFDEVMTGFRVGPQGMQGLTGIRPDLVTLGKVIGGGMPVGAFGGRRELMEQVAPLGAVYQAGTLSGSPVAVAAGLASLELLDTPGFYETLETRARTLVQGLAQAAAEADIPVSGDSIGGMFGLYFAPQAPRTYAEMMQCDAQRFRQFFHAMLERGHAFAPSAFEAGFVSFAHSEEDIAATVRTGAQVFAAMAKQA